MEQNTETKTTTNSNNGSHAGGGGSTNGSAASGIGGITDRPSTATATSSSVTTTAQQTNHNNMSLGCGSTTTPTMPAVNNSNSLKSNMACSNSSAASAASSAKSVMSSASSAAAAAAAAAAIKSLQKSGLIGHNRNQHSAAATTTNITQFATSSSTLPQTSQHHHHHPNLAGLINVNVNTTTGGSFGVTVDPNTSVENLKKVVAKKLKVSKDRICLLYREKELENGSLKDNNLVEGSKILLLPNVETGLLAQRPENTVMQALESLNDSQVNDFLSGKTPLNLSMRLGDHMMLIQLQLSTVNPAAMGPPPGSNVCSAARMRSANQRSGSNVGAAAGAASTSNGTNGSNLATVAGATTAAANNQSHQHHIHLQNNPAAANGAQQQQQQAAGSTSNAARKLNLDASSTQAAGSASSSSTAQRNITIQYNNTNSGANRSTTLSTGMVSGALANGLRSSDLSSFLSKHDYESLQNIVKSIAMSQPARRQAAAALANQQQQQAMRANSTAAPSTSAAAAAAQQKSTAVAAASTQSTTSDAALLEQSPIKSLSNLVSSPIKTTAIKHIPIKSSSSSSNPAAAASLTTPHPQANMTATPSACQQDPIAAKLTSCLCTRLNPGAASAKQHCIEHACAGTRPETTGQSQQRSFMITSTPNGKAQVAINANSNSNASLHKTANNPITRSKHRQHHHHHHHHHHHFHHHQPNGTNTVSATPISFHHRQHQATVSKPQQTTAGQRCYPATSNDSGFGSDDSIMTVAPPTTAGGAIPKPAAAPSASTPIQPPKPDLDDSGVTMASDTRTLAEASRNLTQTLRKLSKEVFHNKIDLGVHDDDCSYHRKKARGAISRDSSGGCAATGAVIESMKNHGKGIYSGTFSGTLNPALQDRFGRPKRDISTVIHILNDLLSATPQYSRGARISFDAPSTSGAAAAANADGSRTHDHNTRSKQQLHSKHHSHSCVKCAKAAHAHAHSHASSGSNGQSSSTTQCNYGECNGHYKTKSAYACCQDVAAAAATTACQCRYRSAVPSASAAGGDVVATEREREFTCQKCLSDLDNLKTKSKMNQIRLVMQQSKQKREARKLKGAPYGTRVAPAAATAATTSSSSTQSAQPATAMLASQAAANKGQNANNATELSSSTPAAATTTLATTAATTTTAASAATSEVSPNHLVEEVDTAA